MKYLSLFSGIGGFELALDQAYEDHAGNKSTERAAPHDHSGSPTILTQLDPRPVCVGYSEIDRYAIQIYERHFPGNKQLGNIKEIKGATLPDFELLVGGFPCQAFSIAGRRGGFDDTRGTLFFEIARILEEKQPRFVLLENVKGLLSHRSGQTFRTILLALDEIGYDCEWEVLNSKHFGVPQNRERVFIVGHLRGGPRPEVFPIGESHSGHAAPAKRQGPTSLCLSTRGGSRNDPTAHTLKARADSGIDAKHLQTLIVQRGRGRNGGGIHRITPTLSSHDWQNNNCLNGIRRLTPLECERLQGFPDGWTEGVSDTQRYKCLGNAVTVPVVRAIARRLLGRFL
jgi:DNA (cytosine-5)-methyltransferase 1